MRIAQQLYEGVDIKGSGTVGLITYLRTDSTRISEEADAAVREYIKEGFGEEYVAEGERIPEQGSVPSVSACVETLYRQQNAAGEI